MQTYIIGISCGVQGEDLVLRRYYGEKLGAAGLGAVALPSPVGDNEAYAAKMAEMLDGLLLSGGGDLAPAYWGERPCGEYQADSARDEWELVLCREFLAVGKPVLGICRGMQVLNVSLGGSLWQDLGENRGICHRQGTAPEEYGHPVWLWGWLRARIGELGNNGSIYVNSLHHQGVRQLGRNLRAGAYAPDGLVEAVYLANMENQMGEGWGLGLQWHPERLEDEPSRIIWQEFARAVRERHKAEKMAQGLVWDV